MSKNYDNWERLVDAVLRREQLRQLALCNSEIYSSFSSSPSSSFNSETCETPDDQEIISTTDFVSFFRDEGTGKKCYMLGARELIISWGDTPTCWKWTPHADSRFPEVAQLEYVWWMDIRCKIKTRLLSGKTRYAAFLVFKLAEGSKNLDVANAIIRFVDDETDKGALRRAHIVHLQRVENITGTIAASRADGWMEVEMGNFYFDKGDEGEVEVRLLETTRCKAGLIVKGFEFRPTYKETSFVLKKKQVGERKEKGRKLPVLLMRKSH